MNQLLLAPTGMPLRAVIGPAFSNEDIVDLQRLLIIDFGSQVTQLIARRLREIGVYCEIHPYQKVTPEFVLDRFRPMAIILSGGPASAAEPGHPCPPAEIYDLGIPVLGICYGQQVMMAQLGGVVEQGQHREFGRAIVTAVPDQGDDGLLYQLFEGGGETVWMSHGDRVSSMAPGFKPIGSSPNAPLAIVADHERKFYGLQFHPEVHHTPNGGRLLRNFVRIAGFDCSWSMAAFRDQALTRIRRQVGDSRVVCGLSGGVDSSVTALLLHKAIPDQVTCVFVDHGLLRKSEAEQVVSMFRGQFNIPLVHVEAADRFLAGIAGLTDPEDKRKTIGRLFVDVFTEIAGTLEGAEFLAQGTLYPDVIESVSVTGGPSATIKSHHNVGGLPEQLGLKLVEPLRELFKDEVRELGRQLGLPEEFVGRHPFPGPGLAIRCCGEITAERLHLLREADAVFIDQIRSHGLYDQIWQAFAVLLPVRTVGVMGDNRTYDLVCGLRAVTSVDGMTADFFDFSHRFLSETANRIVNEVPGINRVVYDVTSKPPGTIEWE